MRQRKRKYGFAVVALAAVAVVCGAASQDNLYKIGKNIEILVNLYRNANMFYVDEVDPNDLMEAAAEGMTKFLDPYSEYLPAESMDDFAARTSGKYGGVGSLIRQRGEWVEFSNPYEGSPADKAGIRPGDKIVEIEGQDAKGMDSQRVSDLLRGDPGSKVKLKVEKFPSGEVVSLNIRRERIAIPSVPYYGIVGDSIGYIVHSDFTEDCSREVMTAYNELRQQGVKALVLDYRGNTGGILQEAVKILSMFLPKGTEVVSMRSTKNPENNISFKTEQQPIDTTIPIVALTDGSSASAAEIVVGALQDTDRAVVVGQRTFGKGLVQTTYPLGYNAYAKLTTNKYYLPSGRCIQAVDYTHKDKTGRGSVVPDSLAKEFKTLHGRSVYDGGGVRPDVEMEPEYASTFAYVVYGMGLVDDFINNYCRNHYDSLRVVPNEYRFEGGAYEEFVAFMADKEVPWQSEASLRWKEFKKALEKERTPEDIKAQMDEIESNINITTEDNLRLYQRELEEIIEGQMVLRYCYERGSIEHNLDNDKELKRAIEILSNKAAYENLLAPTTTTEKE